MATAAFRRFSSRGNALLATLGVVAALLLVLALVTAERGGDERRTAVSRYIHDLNALQVHRAVDGTAIASAYATLELNPEALEEAEPRLVRAERGLEELRTRVGALEPPPEAADLHREVLRLLELETGLAGEVTAIARYLPRLAEVEADLRAATEALGAALERADALSQQQRAFGRYATALDGIAERLESLTAPEVLEASRSGDAERLRTLADLAGRLRAAIGRSDETAVARLYAQLSREASRSGATRAERRAVLAYNDRLRELAEQGRTVELERARLDAEIRN
jgi:hypothetical protein